MPQRISFYRDMTLGAYYCIQYRFHIGQYEDSRCRIVTEEHYICLEELNEDNIRGLHIAERFPTEFSKRYIVDIQECSWNDYYNSGVYNGFRIIEDTGPTIQDIIRTRTQAPPAREPKEWTETEVLLHKDGVCVI